VDLWSDPEYARRWVEDNTGRPHSPLREEQLDLLLAILRAHLADPAMPRRVLDLGCGGGVVAERVLDQIEDSAVACVDGSPPMLEMARERLARFAARATFTHADFESFSPERLPDRPYGAAFAVQAIHNAADEAKRRTLAGVRAALAPGGLFVLSDRVGVAAPGLFPTYLALWDLLDARYAAAGHPWRHAEGRSVAEHERTLAENGDLPGSLEQNLLWLREAGFADVATVHVVGVRAVIVARAPRA
jgi:tRNA (cmo5U34)-methyltransferase